jgi:CBS domain-containing protein
MSKTEHKLTAGDVMQAAVKTVPSTMTLPDFESKVIDEQVSGFPVVDEGKLVGVISRSDVVRQICNEREVAKNTSDFYFDETGFYESVMASLKDIADRVGERIEGLCVKDVMVSNPRTVALDQPISDVARCFVEHRIHRLPVTDHGTLVGIVTTMDLVRLIADRTRLSN